MPTQPECLVQAGYGESVRFWETQLLGLESQEFPLVSGGDAKARGLSSGQFETLNECVVSQKDGQCFSDRGLLYAAWALIIGHHTRTQDVCFGTVPRHPISPRCNLARLVKPTRICWQSDTSISLFMHTLQAKVESIQQYSGIDLDEISDLSKDAADSCKFRSIVIVHGDDDLPHSNVQYDADSLLEPPAIILECKVGNGCTISAKYDKGLIDKGYMSNLLAQLIHVHQQLRCAVAESAVCDIDPFCPNDLAQVREWNKNLPPESHQVVCSAFDEQYYAHPNALAVYSWDGEFTYDQLHKLSSRLATYLVEIGVQIGTIVPLCFDKSIWAIVSMVAVMRAGGCCVNLSPSHPKDRVQRIIEMCESNIVLTTPQHAPLFADSSNSTVVTKAFVENLPIADHNRFPAVSPDDTAYILFTSGSTGEPKGIVIEHGSLCTSSEVHGSKWDIGLGTRVFQFASFTFDVSVADIFFSLMRGACVCMPSEEDRLNDPAGAARSMGVTWANLTPSVANLMLPEMIPSLKMLVLGGEATSRKNLHDWAEHVDLIVITGPAETTIHLMGGNPASKVSDPSNVGVAISGRIWIVDPSNHDRLAPIGAIGELLIEGRIVAREYFKDPKRTASAFVQGAAWLPHSQNIQSKAHRIFKSGDLVSYNSDGTVRFIGRKDNQVKIRGQRVELGEIEHQIRNTLPGIEHVVPYVSNPSDHGGRFTLVAFLVFDKTPNDSVERSVDCEAININTLEKLRALKSALIASLPSYMVPSLYVPLGRIPLTLNGKNDARKLRSIFQNLTKEQLKLMSLTKDLRVDFIEQQNKEHSPPPKEISSAMPVNSKDRLEISKSNHLKPSNPTSSLCESKDAKNMGVEHRFLLDLESSYSAEIYYAAWAIMLWRYADFAAEITFSIDVRSAALLRLRLSMLPILLATSFLQLVTRSLPGVDSHTVPSNEEIQHTPVSSASSCLSKTIVSIWDSSGDLDETFGRMQAARYSAQCDFELRLTRNGKAGHISVMAEVITDSNALPHQQMRNVLEQFRFLANQLASVSASTRLVDLEFVGPHDLAQIMYWNKDLPLSLDENVPATFGRQTLATPFAPAICSKDCNLAYEQLYRYTKSLALFLVNCGLAKESIVPLCFDKSPWAIVSMMAVLMAGGTISMLSASFPIHRINMILSKCHASLIMSDPQHSHLFENADSEVVVVDESFIKGLSDSDQTSLPDILSSQAAYVVFTSGTTGSPKAIVVEHGSLCTSSEATGIRFGIGPGTRVLQFSAYPFDASIGDIFFSLMRGACICSPSEQERVESLPMAVARMQANWVFLTPSVVSTLQPSSFPSLKTLLVGGEMVTRKNLSDWANSVSMHLMMGPSECTVYCMGTDPVGPADDPSGIGYAMSNRLWVVDPADDRKLSPIGCTGELVIEGRQVARGYLGMSEFTAQAFCEEKPWLPLRKDDASQRFYRSGDLVRLNWDGSMSFIGRKSSEQVKIRGQRVELAEIENTIKQAVPALRDAIVLVNKIEWYQGRHSLVAFLIRGDAPSSVVNSEDLQAKLFSLLPNYMVPTLFVPLEQVPINLNGKTDRSQLESILEALTPEEVENFSSSSKVDEHPISPKGLKLRELWASTLVIRESEIGTNSHFIRLGGDSLQAMTLVTLASASGHRLQFADIMNYPTFKEMVEHMVPMIASDLDLDVEAFELLGSDCSISTIKATIASSCQIDVHSIEDIYPCSPLQEGLISLTSKNSTSYIMRNIYQLPADVDIDSFKSAWEKVSASVDILRTRIALYDQSRPLQVLVKAHISWHIENSFDAYLDWDSAESMGNGRPLARFGLVKQGNTWHFFLTCHHALYDGYSLPLLLKRVNDVYYSKIGVPFTPFKRYIKYVHHTPIDEMSHFWKLRLDEASQPSWPPASEDIDKVEFETLSVGVLPRLNSEFTMPTLLQASFAILLSTYNDSQEVTFALTVSGRNHPVNGVLNMLGPTISTIPFRTVIDKGVTVNQLCSIIHKSSLETLPYEYFGIQNIRRLSSDIEQTCKLRSHLVIQPLDEMETSSEGLFILATPSIDHTNTYGLSLECRITRSGVELVAEYDPQVLSAKQVKRFQLQFMHILGQMTLNLESRVDSFSLVTRDDLEEIGRLNNNSMEVHQRCVHQMVSDVARIGPDRSAIESWDGNFTYGQLEDLSTRLAVHLRSLGLRHNDMVPICSEKSAWVLVAMLAVLRAGGAFVPLDPSNPHSRLRGIVDQVNANIIIVSSDQRPFWVSAVNNIVDLSSNISNLSLSESTLLQDHSDSSSLAYLIFTSGSTGVPKGVEIEHGAYLTAALSRMDLIHRGHNTRVLQFNSYSFDACIEDIFTTLITGGTICIATSSEIRNDLVGAMNRFHINCIDLTPSVANLLTPCDVPSLEVLIIGGEALSAAHVRKWAPHVKLVFTYGPSECAIVSTTTRGLTLASDATDIGTASCGRTWIVDPLDHHRLMPYGAVGELLMEGPLLARGYVNNKEKTDEAFVRDLAWASPKSRFYKTGDLVRYLDNGNLRFIGRKDSQIKIRGQRVEIAEVEGSLKLCSDASSIAVEFLRLPNNKQILVAFCCFSSLPGARLPTSETELKSTYRNTKLQMMKIVPIYMVPTVFITLDKMPVTISGKLNRRRLRSIVLEMPDDELDKHRLEDSVSIRRPSTREQKFLQGLWSSSLGISPDRIGIDSNFFALGGDSIDAMRLAGAVNRSGHRLTVSEIFHHPTLSDMTTVLKDFGNAIDCLPGDPAAFSLLHNNQVVKEILSRADVGIREDEVEDMYPCTPLQEGLMAISSRQSQAYVVQQVYKLSSETEVDRFQGAWESTIKASPILRTRIVYVQGLGSMQIVLRKPDEWASSDNLQGYLQYDRTVGMGYGTQLSRFCLVHDARDQAVYFVYTAHHATFDGYSSSILSQTVTRLYHDSGVHSPATPSFNRFVRYLQEIDASASYSFWQRQLTGSPSTTIFSRHRSSSDSRHESVAYGGISIEKTKRLCELLSTATTATIIRAAWALVMGRFSESDDVLFGATLSGRDVPVAGIEDICAPTITTIPVRISIDRNQGIREFVMQVQQQALESTPHQHYGLQNMRLLNRQVMDLSTILVIHPEEEQETTLCESLMEPHGVEGDDFAGAGEQGYHKQPLVLIGYLKDDGVGLKAVFNDLMISRIQVERMMSTLQHIIQGLCYAVRNTQVGEILWCSDEASQQISSWNERDAVPKSSTSTVHELIRMQSRSRPESLAIHSWDAELTFEEVEFQSSLLASYFGTLGVRQLPDLIIPIIFDKSALMVVAIISVLKAGAAYTLLNPDQRTLKLRRKINRLRTEVVLVSPEHYYRVHTDAKHVLSIDIEFLNKLSLEVYTEQPMHGSAAAAIVFESESQSIDETGTAVSHSSLCVLAETYGPYIRIGYEDRVLQLAPVNSGAATCEILVTLARGACLCIPGGISNLADTISDLSISWVYITNSIDFHLHHLDEIPSLKTVMIEVISQASNKAGEEDRSMHPNHTFTMVRNFGVTEACTWSSFEVFRHTATRYAIKPVSGCQIWLTDPYNHNTLLPPGVVGEILLEGPLLASRYLDHDDCNLRRFVDNPTWTRASSTNRRFLKSGRLGRYNNDGSITLFGCKTTMAKIGGQHIDLDSIETYIRHSCKSLTTTVHVVEIKDNDQRIVALLSNGVAGNPQSLKDMEPGLDVSEDMLRKIKVLGACISDDLPAYMVPMIIPVMAMPGLGEKDSDSLARKYTIEWISRQSEQSTAERPSDESKGTSISLLRDFWAEILDLPADSISPADSFFGLGGDSISAIRLSMAATSYSLETRLTVADIFQKPRLCDMAASFTTSLLTLSSENDEIKKFSLIQRFGTEASILNMLQSDWGLLENCIDDVLPCTPLQEALMALSIQQEGAYVAKFVYKLPVDLDHDKFVQASQATVDAFDILRTRIVPSEGHGSLQVIIPDDKITWDNCQSLSDLCHLEVACNSYGRTLASFHLVGLDDPSKGIYFGMRLNHAIYDAWSLSLILKHVEDVYFARPAVAPTPFKSFVKYLVQSDSRSHDHFWSEELKDLHAIDFPRVRSLSPRTPFRTSTNPLEFDLDNRSNFTLSTILQAAWGLIVAVNSHSNDVVFGLTLSGRDAPIPGIECIGGPTLMNVPRRIQIDHNCTVEDLLESLQNRNSSLLEHGHIGIQAIKRLPGLQRLSFQNLLTTHIRSEVQESVLFEKDVDPQANDFHTLPLLISCTSHRQPRDSQSRIEIEANFDQNIISKERVERLMSQMVTVAQQFCDTSRVLRDIDVCTSKDEAQMEQWNSKEPLLVNNTIHDSIYGQSQLSPLASAVCSWDGNFTYQQLENTSKQVVSYIRSSVECHNDSVFLICLERSRWVPVIMYGILKSGCAYGLLDRNEDSVRLLRKLRDTGACAVIVDSTTETLFEDENCHTARIMFDWQKLESGQYITGTILRDRKHSTTRDPAIITFPQNPRSELIANVLDHRSICSWYEANRESLALSSETRALHATSYVSDVASLELLATLMAGGCVCIVADTEYARRTESLEESIRRLDATHAFLTPTTLRSLALATTSGLKQLVLHGEAFGDDTIANCQGTVQISAIYTPMTCVFATLYARIGLKSVPNNFMTAPGGSSWIVNPDNEEKLALVGAIGELWMDEHLVAKSCIRINESTNVPQFCDRKWVSRMHGGKSHRTYKTGELAYYEDDGSVTVLTQHKHSTFQGDLANIDTVLMEQHIRRALPDAGNLHLCVEIVNPKDSANSTVVGFLSLKSLLCPGPTQRLEQEEDNSSTAVWIQDMIPRVQQQLSLRFPPFMLPAFYILLKAMPVTISDTVDHERVCRFASSIDLTEVQLRVNSETADRAPTSSMEMRMQEMWVKVLGTEKSSVGIDDAFIPLGGDSISAMRLVALARSNGIKLSVAEILSADNTLRKLSAKAKLIRLGPVVSNPGASQVARNKRIFADERLRESITTQISSNVEDVEDIAPATDYQTVMVTSGMLASRGWSNYIILDFPKTVAPRALEYACMAVVTHHPILRTAFFAHQQELWQAVYRSITVSLAHFSSIADTSLSCDEWIRKDRLRPSTLNRRELRGATFEAINGGSVLVIGLSHAMWDGVALPMIVNDIHSSLNSQSLNSRPSFTDFACFIHEQDNSEGKRYWKDLLKGATMTKIIDHKGYPYRAPLNTTLTRLIPTPDFAAHGFTFATILKTAWGLVLSAWSGESDVCFGYLVSGRSSPFDGIDQVVGPCINMLPVRLDVSQGTELELLQRTQSQHLAALPFECLGYQQIIRDCTTWPRWQRFSSMVQHQNLDSASLTPENAKLRYRLVCPPVDSADVLIISIPRGNQTEVTVTVSDVRWDESIPNTILDALCQVISDLASGVENKAILDRDRLEGLPPLTSIKDTHDGYSYRAITNDGDKEGKGVIADIWYRLGYEIGLDVNEPFYVRTGSISTALQFIDLFQRELGIEVTMEELLEMPTIRLQTILWREKQVEDEDEEWLM